VVAIALYDWLKALHVFLAVVWVGGAFMLNILAVFALRSTLPGRRAEFAREADWFGKFFFPPIAIAVLGLGFWLIYELDWGYPLWIVLGLVGFGLSFVLGAGVIGPQSGKIAPAIEQYGPDSPEAATLIRRVVNLARLDLVILTAVIFVMVLKPT
jgi:uncharacterized membrane protein